MSVQKQTENEEEGPRRRGAPNNNRNAYKHGLYSDHPEKLREFKEQLARTRRLERAAKDLRRKKLKPTPPDAAWHGERVKVRFELQLIGLEDELEQLRKAFPIPQKWRDLGRVCEVDTVEFCSWSTAQINLTKVLVLRDVFGILVNYPHAFDTKDNFLRALLETYLAPDDRRWLPKYSSIYCDAQIYAYNWIKVCETVLHTHFPPVPRKKRQTTKK